MHKPTQPIEYLEELIPVLVDPVEHAPVEVRRYQEQVVGLISTKGDVYEVRNNIPMMVPNMNRSGIPPKLVKAWTALQDKELEDYAKTSIGVFSVDGNEIAIRMAKMMKNAGMRGRCLDIGCGVLPTPAYMSGQDDVRFIGVDPFLGNNDRDFPFVQAIGEFLPFKDHVFDGAMFASTIDHHMDPRQALREALRVLKREGRLYIWYTNKKMSMAYLRWKMSAKPKQFDAHHQWAFTDKSMRVMVEECGFKANGSLPLGDGTSKLLIASVSG